MQSTTSHRIPSSKRFVFVGNQVGEHTEWYAFENIDTESSDGVGDIFGSFTVDESLRVKVEGVVGGVR